MPGKERNHEGSKFGEKARCSVISTKHYLWDLRYGARGLLCHDGLRPARSEQSLRGLGNGSNDRCTYYGRGSGDAQNLHSRQDVVGLLCLDYLCSSPRAPLYRVAALR
jgi:hypothetical protein